MTLPGLVYLGLKRNMFEEFTNTVLRVSLAKSVLPGVKVGIRKMEINSRNL